MSRRNKKMVVDAALIVVGVLIMSLAYVCFMVPNKIAPGGLTGLSTVFHYLFGLPVGTMTLVMNIPLFLMGFRRMGLFFALRSLFATVTSSLLIDFLPLPALTSNPMLASIFGGLAMGIGLGMILKGGATTGGSDLLASLIAIKLPQVRLSIIIFAVDTIVVLLSGIVFDPETALYALIALYISTIGIDFVQEGPKRAKTFMVVTNDAERMSKHILEKLNHGVTKLYGKGMYSGEERDMLFCVVYRSEVSAFKEIMREVDPTAFSIIFDVHEAIGEGFTYGHESLFR